MRHCTSLAFLLATSAMLGGCNGGKTHDLWNDLFHCHGDNGAQVPPLPPPLANAIAETLVLANGGVQESLSGLTENSAIIGEPFQTGMLSTAGIMVNRHGFTPPNPPAMPHGIAQGKPVVTNVDTINQVNLP